MLQKANLKGLNQGLYQKGGLEDEVFLTRFSAFNVQCARSTVIELHVIKPFQITSHTKDLPNFCEI